MYVEPVDPTDLSPTLRQFWDEASAGGKRFIQAAARAPEHAERLFPYYVGLRFGTKIGIRHCEILRLAIAQTTRCPNCLEARVDAAGLTDADLMAIGGQERGDFDERELALIDFAYRFGSDHFSIAQEHFETLGRLFTQEEIVEIGMLCAQFLGFGRMAMTFGMESISCPLPQPR